MVFSFWVFWFWISSFRHFRWINLLSVAPFLGAWRPKVKKLQLFSSVLVSRIGTWLGRFTHTFLRFLNFSFFGCLVRIKKGWEGRGGIACLGCYWSSLCLCYLTVECSTFEMSEIRGGSPSFYCTVRRFLRERIGGRVIMLFWKMGKGHLKISKSVGRAVYRKNIFGENPPAHPPKY